jgi:hypothetical protein
VTATRDRHSDLDDDHAEPAWDERPIFGSSRGLPWWGAVLLAFGLALVAGVIDMQRQDSLGRIYQGAYILGCVAAICLVRRGNLFGPMVQPPLVFAVTAIGTVLTLAPDTPGGGLKAMLFTVALPLTSNFPTMAGTTVGVVAIGLGRLFFQRNPDKAVEPSRKRSTDDDDDSDPRPLARRPRPAAAVAGEPVTEGERPARRPARDESAPRPRPTKDARPARDERPARGARPPRPARDDRPVRDERPPRSERPSGGERRPRDEDRPRPQRDDPRARRDPDRAREPGRPREDRSPDPERRPSPNRQPRRPRPDER